MASGSQNDVGGWGQENPPRHPGMVGGEVTQVAGAPAGFWGGGNGNGTQALGPDQ